ncbi:MAG: hypothetical protein AAB740_02685 [Patescibacteria group bacterium]
MPTKIVLMAILAGLSVALAGVLGWQKLNQPETSRPIVNQERQNLNETAGWETYRNEQYGFEIKYPVGTRKLPEYEAKNIFNDEGNVIFSGDTKTIDLIDRTKRNYLEFFGVATDIPTFNCYFSPRYGEIYSKSIRKEVRNAFSEFCLNITEGSGADGGRYRDYYYTIMKDGQYLLLYFKVHYFICIRENCEKFVSFDESKDTQIIDQMLSTFKFIK